MLPANLELAISMDDYFGRYRSKVGAVNKTIYKSQDFISKSTSKVEVLLEKSNTAIPVIFINKDKEGISEAVMYCYHDAGVEIADYINFLGRTYLVISEIKNLEREDYIDAYRLVICNVDLEINGTSFKAYFRGALKSVQSEETRLAQNFGLDSLGDAYIITPAHVGTTLNQVIIINGLGWKVKYIDETTNDGISYVALEEFVLINTSKASVNEIEEEPLMVLQSFEVFTPELKPGITHTFNTESGYIKTDQTINILERTANYVKFIIPFHIKDITIETKNNGEIISEYYKVGG